MPTTLRVDEIKVREDWNPRHRIDADQEAFDALVSSVSLIGIVQSLTVTPNDTGFYLVDGHRRLAAAKRAGLEEVPVSVRHTTQEGSDLLDAVIANQQHEKLGYVEEARAFGRLKAQGYTPKGIAEVTGASQAKIKERLRCLALPVDVLDFLQDKHPKPETITVLLGSMKVDKRLPLILIVNAVEKRRTVPDFVRNPASGIDTDPAAGIWRLGQIDADEFPESEEVTKQLEACERAGLRVTTVTVRSYREEAVQGNFAFGGEFGDPITLDAAFVADVVVRELKLQLKRHKARVKEAAANPALVNGSTATLAPPEQSREELLADRREAHNRNLTIWMTLVGEAAPKLDLAAFKAILAMALAGNTDDKLARRGLRYVDAGLVTSKDGKHGTTYSYNERYAAAALIDYVDGATSIDEAFARFAHVCAIATHATEEVVSMGQRHHSSPLRDYEGEIDRWVTPALKKLTIDPSAKESRTLSSIPCRRPDDDNDKAYSEDGGQEPS